MIAPRCAYRLAHTAASPVAGVLPLARRCVLHRAIESEKANPLTALVG